MPSKTKTEPAKQYRMFPGLPARLFVAGVPACGKTSLGEYLRAEAGYEHQDFEKSAEGVVNLLIDLVNRDRKQEACEHLSKIVDMSAGAKCIITWGFPPEQACLRTVEFLHEQGFTPWWFHGDRHIARNEWMRREQTANPYAFNRQLWRIGGAWPDLAHIFGHRVIRTLHHDWKRTPPEDVALTMGNHVDF